MSRNSSGTYTQPGSTAAVSGATIDPTAFNTLITDLGSELTNSLDRGGRGALTAAMNAGGFKITNAAEPTVSTDLATKNYVDTTAVTNGSVTPAKLSTGAPTWDTSGNFLFEKDQAAATIVKVYNNSTGASPQARFDWATGTANSFSIAALIDNSGSPYWNLSHGSAVTAAFFDAKQHVWRDGSSVEAMRINTSRSLVLTQPLVFADATTQSTAAAPVSTTNVLAATAGASVGAVGTYAFLNNQSGATLASGSTTAGSNLRYSDALSNILGTPSGTWRTMGYAIAGNPTLFLRIS